METQLKRERLLKRNAKRREQERLKQKKHKDREKTYMLMFGLGSALLFLAVVTIGITWVLLHVTFGAVAGLLVAGLLK